MSSNTLAQAIDYFPVRAATFISGAQCLFDVFVKLGDGRFVKILRAGDSFMPNLGEDLIQSMRDQGLSQESVARPSGRRSS